MKQKQVHRSQSDHEYHYFLSKACADKLKREMADFGFPPVFPEPNPDEAVTVSKLQIYLIFSVKSSRFSIVVSALLQKTVLFTMIETF